MKVTKLLSTALATGALAATVLTPAGAAILYATSGRSPME